MEYLEFLLAHGSPAGTGTAVFAVITAVVAMIGAVLGAIAALPPAQRALAPPPPEVLYADYIPIEHIEEDRYTIRCKHDTIMQTWRLTGLDHTGLSNAERDRLYRAREATLNALAMEAGNLELRFITVRERGSAADAQRRLYGTQTVNTIVEKWNEAAGEDVCTNRHYLLTYAKDSPEGRKALEHAHAAITGALAAYDPKRLSAPEASGPEMEEGPEAPLAAWLVPASRPRMFTTTGASLAEMLACDEMVVFGGGRMVFNGGGRSCEAAVLGVQALPDAFNEQLTLEIMRAPAELTVAHTLKPHDRAKEIITLQRQAKVAGDVAIGDGEGQKAQIQEANEIVQGTHEAGLNANVWTYNLTIVVYAPSREALERAVVPVERALTLAGATAVREGFAAEAAWWSVLPTFPRDRPQVALPHLPRRDAVHPADHHRRDCEARLGRPRDRAIPIHRGVGRREAALDGARAEARGPVRSKLERPLALTHTDGQPPEPGPRLDVGADEPGGDIPLERHALLLAVEAPRGDPSPGRDTRGPPSSPPVEALKLVPSRASRPPIDSGVGGLSASPLSQRAHRSARFRLLAVRSASSSGASSPNTTV